MKTSESDIAKSPEKATVYYPNMDIVRYVLSLAVVFAHIEFLAGIHVPIPISSYDAVGGFFAMSGFLMYHSYVKHRNFLRYTADRARRILPPYIFIVVLCAFGLAYMSDLSPIQYYCSEGLWEYLGANLAFLNWLHPGLPGVFEGTEFTNSAVNGSLWTMKVEWCLYLSVPLSVWLASRSFNRLRISKESLALLIVLFSIVYRLTFYQLWISSGKEIYEILSRQIFGQLSYFYCGMYIYFRRDWLRSHSVLMLFAGICLYAVSMCGDMLSIVLAPFAISAMVMGICFLPKDIKVLRHRRNFSYEIYLFHWPVIQLAVLFDLTDCGVVWFVTAVLVVTSLLSLGFCAIKVQ